MAEDKYVWPEGLITKSLFSDEKGLYTGGKICVDCFKRFFDEKPTKVWLEIGLANEQDKTISARVKGQNAAGGSISESPQLQLFRSFEDMPTDLDDETFACHLRKQIDAELDGEINEGVGKSMTYLYYNSANWYELDAKDRFNHLFNTANKVNKCGLEGASRTNYYAFPSSLINYINETDLSFEGGVEIVFGIRCGVLPSWGLSFSPILRMPKNPRGIHFSVNFNYLRPCPPFGNCPPPPVED